MGVRGLQSYLERCCRSASTTVSIPDLATEYRLQNHIQEPVIVVDGQSLIRHLYGDLEWIGGGQLKQFGERAQHFVEAFESIGIHLVFFFDGPTVQRKRRAWIDRRMRTLDSMYYVLDEIEKGTPSSRINRRDHFHLPPGLGQLSRLIFEIICGCEVYQSLGECDEEIAAYARDNGVFAILSQDSDFVIMNAGNALYLSIEKLNLENMTTIFYDQWELAQQLGIKVFQLPLLATFLGNDIIPLDDLKNFHQSICHINLEQKPYWRVLQKLIPNLTRYIRSLGINQKALEKKLPQVSNKIFGNVERSSDLLNSLRSYNQHPLKEYEREEQDRMRKDNSDKDPSWCRIMSEARHRHQNNKLPGLIYGIMSGLPFESSTSIEDFRKQDLPSFARATETIRKRIYGILLQEKPLPRNKRWHEVEEWCSAGHGSLDEAHISRAEPPQYPHPGLIALWRDRSKHMSGIRWELFVHSISPTTDVRRVSSLPTYLVVPTLILILIKELGCLEDWEIEAMLATATCLQHYDNVGLAKLPSDPMLVRGIRVANLIMRCTFVVYVLLAACGYPLTVKQTAPWLFFDGKLFQIKYRQASNSHTDSQLCDNKVRALEHFQLARDVVFAR